MFVSLQVITDISLFHSDHPHTITLTCGGVYNRLEVEETGAEGDYLILAAVFGTSEFNVRFYCAVSIFKNNTVNINPYSITIHGIKYILYRYINGN